MLFVIFIASFYINPIPFSSSESNTSGGSGSETSNKSKTD